MIRVSMVSHPRFLFKKKSASVKNSPYFLKNLPLKNKSGCDKLQNIERNFSLIYEKNENGGMALDRKDIISEVKRTILEESEAIRALSGQLDMEKAARLVELIGDGKGKVVVAGCGTSAMAARKVVHSLNCIECTAVFLTPSDAVHGGLGVLKENDILILISKGGNTEELVQLIPPCRSKGAVLVGVTEDEASKIGKAADLCLQVKAGREPCRFNMLATASTLAVLSVFDAVCIALMQYTEYTKEQFAVIHPKGAVGERLLGKEDPDERYDEGGRIQRH